MRDRILAERFAKALFSLGLEEKSLDRFRDEIGRLAKALSSEPQLLKILSYKELAWEKRENILSAVAAKLYLSPYVQNFLKLILRRGRIQLFPFIADAFEKFVRNSENVMIAKVKVVNKESFKFYNADLQKTLEKITGKKIEFEISEEPALIGGLQVALGDKIYDASVQGELSRIQENWIL